MFYFILLIVVLLIVALFALFSVVYAVIGESLIIHATQNAKNMQSLAQNLCSCLWQIMADLLFYGYNTPFKFKICFIMISFRGCRKINIYFFFTLDEKWQFRRIFRFPGETRSIERIREIPEYSGKHEFPVISWKNR